MGRVGERFTPARLVVLAFALPVVLTASVLAQVAWNQSAWRGPIVLTEREMYVSPGSDDNTARRGWIAWHVRSEDRNWMRRDALAALGFDLSVDAASPDAARHYRRMLPRRAWVAFELGGPRSDEPRPGLERASRLVPIDISSNSQALVERYPDGGRYLITAAIVDVFWQDPPDEPPSVSSRITQIVPNALHISREFAPAVGGGRYRVSVAYGRRFEPWIVAAASH